MTIVYEMGNNLYINLTNRCTNACVFCVRDRKTADEYLSGENLWLEREPSIEEVVEELKQKDISKYDSIVFCGYGEPLMRAEECIYIAKWLRENGANAIRINTNGQANLIHNRDIATEIAGLFDTISISLNAKNACEYQEICQSEFGESAYQGLLDFAKTCAAQTETILSVVNSNLPTEDIEECRRIAESLGCKFRVRSMI